MGPAANLGPYGSGDSEPLSRYQSSEGWSWTPDLRCPLEYLPKASKNPARPHMTFRISLGSGQES